MIVAAQTPDEQFRLLSWMARFIGERPEDLVGAMPFKAFGIMREDALIGGCVFLNYRRHSIEFHIGGAPGWAASMQRADIGALFDYPFHVLGCMRVWCTIQRKNAAARRGAEVLGFKVLGVAGDEFGPGRDGIIYSMRRRECRWIKKHAGDGHGWKSTVVTAADAAG